MGTGKKRILALCAIVCAVILVVGGLFVYNRTRLVKQQNEALAELERNVGQYDEQSIVLYGTSKAKAEELAQLYGAELRITNDGRFARLTLPEGTTIRDIYALEESLTHIDEMAADYQVSISEETEEEDTSRLPVRPQYTVSDADYELQTYLDYLNMGNVWSSYTGSGITVAVIDTGIDTDHPEFAGRISAYSYNATEDKIVKDYGNDWSLIEDEQGHGTAVAGVIAASMNSGNVVGIAPDAQILVIKAECDASGNFARTSDLVFGLYYAIERDVDVVNMSFGTGVNVFEEAAQLAVDSDIICVASAGNESTSALTYPAADENVIGVGALGEGWELAEYSNYGENTDLVAPGTTYTCQMGGGYQTINGTSFSSPIVAAAIALYKQTDKYTTYDEVTEILYASGYDLGELGRDWYYGFGALDISAFLLEERGTITYDMLTDELENEEGLFIRGHALQELPEPERLYAVFDGWYYDDTFTQEYSYYEDEFYGDLTLYAKWVNEDDGIPYTYVILDDGTVEIRSYTGRRRYITIPEKIDGRTVSSIGDFAFQGETRLREINLSSGLKHIGLSAFEGCSNLISIQIPAGVTEIEEAAFKDNVRLSTVAFLGSSKLQTIGDFAFSNCGRLERIELPATVTSVNGSAFFGATQLHTIAVQSGNTAFSSRGGVLYNYTGSTLVAFPAAFATSYTLPETTLTIGGYAFGYAGLKEVDLANVQTIGESGFACSKLETLTIPDGVTVMGASAFASNGSLSSVILGGGLSEISGGAFSLCVQLKQITIPNGIATVGDGAFAYSGLQTVTFEENSTLAIIGGEAFLLCPIQSIEIPDSVVTIGKLAFGGSEMAPSPLQYVGIGENSNLEEIGASAFAYTPALTGISLPSGLQIIDGKAFHHSGLNQITIPASVTKLGDGVFAFCEDLPAVTVEDGNTVYRDENGVVYTIDNKSIHTYPAGREDASYALLDTTETVLPWAFAGANNLTGVALPECLVQISEYGFAYMDGLQSMQIPDNVMQIGRYAFAEDWKLASVTFGENSKLPRISFGAFSYSGLTSFTVPANVSTMAQKAFEGCSKLTQVTFAENSKLESISAYMFDGCSNLRSITFLPGSALTSIQAHGLEGMDKLTSIDFGDAKLTNVDNFAFRFCESLSELTLPETVTSIGRYAFYGCKSMSELTVPAQVEHIGSYAFLGTKDLDLYLVSENMPAYLDENWDHGIRGYYVGVSSVSTQGDYKYAVLPSGNIAILDYLGSETHVDLTKVSLGGSITQIGGSAFQDSTVQTVVLPETLTSIQAEAFAYSDLTEVTVPANVNFIGREAFAYTDIAELNFAAGAKLATVEQYAFQGTEMLTSVTIPASVTTLGTGVFQESGLQSVTFASGIQLSEIPQKAFANTKLTSVTLPDSVTLVNHNAFSNVETLKSLSFGSNDGIRLMSNAFYNTGLTSLHIPANVTYIGEYCFVGLSDLTAITVDTANPNYASQDGLLLSKDLRKLITVPSGRTGSLTVPQSVESLGFGCFEQSKLSAVSFAADTNLLTIGYRAFFQAENLTSIAVPKSVVSIDYYAFAYCEQLHTVTFAEGNKLTGIYEGAFCGDINLESITLPSTIVEISDFAFYGCSKLNRIPVKDTGRLKGIYDYAFAYTGISGEFATPEGLTDIGDYAFLGTKITKLTIPDTNKKDLIIGIGAFEGCDQMTEITLPFIGAGYEDEEISWFGYIFGAGSYEANETYVPVSLRMVTITEGLTTIYTGGFAYCKNLDQIHLPNSVQVLHSDAFVWTEAEYELTNTITTYDRQKQCVAQWGHFGMGITGAISLSNEVYDISGAFQSCHNLLSVNLPECITTIGSSTFYNCTSLVSITIPRNVVSIKEGAFNQCFHLYEVINLSDLKITFGSESNGSVAYCAKTMVDKNGDRTFVDDNHFLTEDGFLFNKTDRSYTLLGYLGTEKTVTLPEMIHESSYQMSGFFGAENVIIPNGVTEIGYGAFYESTGLKSVTLPDTVTRIEYAAFQYCSSLKNITIPESVTYMDAAFCGCTNLMSIRIPEGVTEIVSNTFDGCSKLTQITLTDGLTRIGELAFLGCSRLADITIPDSVQYIGRAAFSGCDSLKSITIPDSVTQIEGDAFPEWAEVIFTGDHPSYVTKDGLVFSADMKELIDVSVQLSGYIVLPDGLESIGDYAFEDCNLVTGITIPESVTRIGRSAFARCSSLEKITIPNEVNSIGDWAFEFCNSLNEISIPNSITSIGEGAFYNCSQLVNVMLPDSLTNIGDRIFDGCKRLTEVRLPAGIKKIPSGMFSGCESLDDFTIPDSVNEIGSSAFSQCTRLTEITLPDGITEINDWTFSQCYSLTYVGLPDSVSSIGVEAFYGCSLSDIRLPSELYAIGEYAFYGCNGLLSITIPESVTKIGDCAFQGCDTLYVVHNLSNLELAIGSKDNGFLAYYADELVNADGETTLSGKYNRTAAGFLYKIDNNEYTLLAYLGNQDAVTLPKTIEGNEYRMDRFRGAKHVILPEGMTVIEENAFRGCTSLRSITIPESVTSIGPYAFYNCSSLREVMIPDGVTSIGEYAFGLSGITSITIPESVLCIPNGMFYRCYHLAEVRISNSVTSIGFDAFFNCRKLTNLTIPDSVTYIGSSTIRTSAFEGCMDLGYSTNGMWIVDGWLADVAEDVLYLTDPGKIRGVCDYAYYNCDLLKTAVWSGVDMPSNVETLYITDINSGTPCVQDLLTLKNVVICDSIGMSDLRYRSNLFDYVSGKTIYVEANEEDLRWDDNFPGWNNGNVVIYGDKWSNVNFYDADGTLLYSEPKRSAEIIRRPAIEEPQGVGVVHTFLGWDLDGDGGVDSVPATTAVDIDAYAIYDRHEHSYAETVTKPTCAERGYTTYTCVCGDSYVDTYVDALGHSWDGGTITVEPTVDAEGQMTFTCTVCGELKTETLPKHVHTYESAVTDPTCTEQGFTTYTCKCGYSYEDNYVEALGHSMGKWYEIVLATCTEPGTEQSDCARCDYFEARKVAPTGHIYEEEVTAPTCTEQGYTTYTCVCGDSYIDDYVDALGHSWDNGVITVEPTEDAEGERLFTCTVCGDTRTEAVPKLDHVHKYSEEITAPTCTEQGYTTYTCACEDSYVAAYTEALGHNLGRWYESEKPTCYETGMEQRDCSECDYFETRELPATGHRYKKAVTEPTCTEQGYTTYTCVCGESYIDNYVEALGHAFGDWNTVKEPNYLENGLQERYCERCDAVESEELNNNPFPDVKADSFKDYILWCSYEGIINGDRQGYFNPENTITRGQFILMLWRAAGEPEPTQFKAFPDVTENNKTYYKAVCWAVEKGITNGKANGDFGLSDPCTRGHVALFLYRYAGQPTPTQYKSFPDVTGGTYYKAVCWLVEQGITNGQKDGTFGVSNPCQRRHVAKFLYLYLNEE